VVESRNPARCFTAADREALEAIAAHTGADIENAQRYAHTGQALAELYQEAREHRDRLQAVLDSTHEGMLMIDRGGCVVLANPRVEALTGLAGDVWQRGTLTELVSSETLQVPARLGYTPGVLCDLLGMLQGEQTPDAVPAERYVFDERHLERSTVPIYDQDGVWIGLLVVLSDVTEAERLEQARHALSSMIVHDLRSPLSAVLGSFNLIESLAPEAGDLAGVLASTTEYSIRAIRRLLNMIESLLDIGRMGSSRLELEREPSDLGGLARAVFDDLRPLADELEIALVLDMPDGAPPLDVDPDRVRRVLLNLVDNALKFTQAEQTVRVVVHPPHDGMVRVDVIDAGPGIPDAHKAHLFDPYMQSELRGRRRGSGLGLTFCRMAVEAHGGRIWIEDVAAGGSVFAFTLPVAKVDALPDDDDG
jgi:signal transduction histidine kinase